MLYAQNYGEVNRLYTSSDGEINRLYKSISLSSSAAFSYEWNNDVNKHNPCFVKFLKSSKAFLQSLFCGYSVNIVKVEEFYIKNRTCKNTIFLDEYNMKLEERNILMRRAEAYAKNPQKTHAERQESKRADNNGTTNNYYVQSFLQTKTNDTSEEWKGTERKVVVFSELKKTVEDEDFKDFDRYFSRENIALLSVKEYEWLFNRSLFKPWAETVSRLLVTKTGPYLIDIMYRKEIAILIMLINDGLLPGVIHLVEKCGISVNSRFDNVTPLIVAAIHVVMARHRFIGPPAQQAAQSFSNC